MQQESIFFYLFGGIAVLFSLLMLTRRNALSAAICLIVCFLSFAGLYVLLEAPLIAAMQVIVYSGAIMMLIIFVIMSIDFKESAGEALKKEKTVIIGSVVAGLIVTTCMVLLSFTERNIPSGWTVQSGQAFGTVENVGRTLFSVHLLNFEMISVLLLIAMVGALVLVKKRNN